MLSTACTTRKAVVLCSRAWSAASTCDPIRWHVRGLPGLFRMCRFIFDIRDEFGITCVLIEHDMGVVMDISDRLVVLDYGRKIADGPPDVVRTDQAVINAYLGVAQADA